MKQTLILIVFCSFFYGYSFSQNPFKYESKVITVSVAKGQPSEFMPTPMAMVSVSQGGFNNTGVGYNTTSVSFDINKSNSPGRRLNVQGAMELIIANLNSQGYALKSSLGESTSEGFGTVTLFFERSSSYREAELYKLINELTNRIDSSSKRYTDSAMTVIQTNVLNYLKSIPNEVITAAYKEQLTKVIVAEAEDKLKKIAEELKKDIHNISTGTK